MLRWLYNRLYPAPTAPRPSAETGELAHEAIESGMRDYREAVSRRPTVDRLVSEAEMQVERNGFGAMITASMGRRAEN